MGYIENVFLFLEIIDDFFWSYIGFAIICIAGFYLTVKSRGKQFSVLFNISKTLKDLIEDCENNKSSGGVNPIKLLFTSVGGMIGIGNIVGVGLAVMLGGPGSILWMWVASICGMLIKYSEIYLGVKHRVLNDEGGYNGGPMYFLQDIYSTKFLALFAAFLLCIYGVEVFQYKVLVSRFENSFGLNKEFVILALLAATFYASSGGIKFLSDVCTLIMPFFLVIYIIACVYIIGLHYEYIPSMFADIFYSAFNGQAAIGGFAGSSMIYAAYMGSSKAVYSGDIGIGFDSTVQSETSAESPVKQARLSIVALLMDTTICTLTSLTIVATKAWQNFDDISPAEVIPKIFDEYFPYSDIFLTSLMFFAGFTTVIAYLVVGSKAANFISEKYGKKIYYSYAVFAFIFFSYFNEEKVVLVMSVTSVFLVILNITTILKMRNQIRFEDETS